MNRRDFLKIAAPSSLGIPILLNGVSAKALSMFELPPECSEVSDRVLVLIQMRGGNDGLNTTIPINYYDEYANYRESIRLKNVGQSNGIIQLDSTLPDHKQIGLHPSMTGFKELYDDGKLNIVQMVGYDQHNLSHFKSTDLMMTGKDGIQGVGDSDGWMANYLNYNFPGSAGNPTSSQPDPIGIQLGDLKPSLGFHSSEHHGVSINLARQDPNGFYTNLSSLGGLSPENFPDSDFGFQLEYITNQKANAEVYSQRLSEVFDQGTNMKTYPDTYLGSQLKTVARLLSGGSKTKIFLVDLTGFDTHVNQVDSGNIHQGNHAELLKELSDAVKVFHDDLSALTIDEKVLTITFSEFGRKAIQNENNGTDHGNYAPMFVIGKYANPGITGNNPNLNQVNQSTGRFYDNQIQHDYRQVYATALQDWLGTDDLGLASVDFTDYKNQKLEIIEQDQVVTPECYIGSIILPIKLTSFSAQAIDNEYIQLEWETSSETETDYFEIQRSVNGQDFETIGPSIQAAGNSSAPLFYDTIDENPLIGDSYYRLKVVNYDGTNQYSDIKLVQILSISTISLSPNPTRYYTYLSFTSEVYGSSLINVFNISGKLIESIENEITPGFVKTEINCTQYSTGYYVVFVEIKDMHQKVIQQSSVKLLVNH